MSQHFLLSAKARSLNTGRIRRMSEEEAYDAFVAIRFAENNGEPFCVWCNCAAVYKLNADAPLTGEGRKRRTFKCQDCHRHFSVTSQTIFASRKLRFTDMLFAIALFTNGAKGMSALEFSRHLGVQYKTAFVLLHKFREALASLQKAQTLSGKVEIDGGYFGGHIRPANRRKHSRDRRKLANQTGKRQCVVIMRERNGKSVPFVGVTENQAVPHAARVIEPGSILYADEAKDYDTLHALFQMKRINHQKRYADGETSTNQAESFFSRLRRMEQGIHHHIAGPYIDSYAGEASWREDNRRLSNGEQFLTIIAAGLHHPISRRWKAYWQRSEAA